MQTVNIEHSAVTAEWKETETLFFSQPSSKHGTRNNTECEWLRAALSPTVITYWRLCPTDSRTPWHQCQNCKENIECRLYRQLTLVYTHLAGTMALALLFKNNRAEALKATPSWKRVIKGWRLTEWRTISLLKTLKNSDKIYSCSSFVVPANK